VALQGDGANKLFSEEKEEFAATVSFSRAPSRGKCDKNNNHLQLCGQRSKCSNKTS
jgi:hypothetical protein